MTAIKDALSIIEADRQRRLEDCQVELQPLLQQMQEILQRHNCSRLYQVQLQDGTWVNWANLKFIIRDVGQVVIAQDAKKM